jgi:predicted heme/steroid binding protein
MRKIKYEPKEAVVRLHNTLVRKFPFLLFNKQISLEELSYFDGGSRSSKNDSTKPTYFSAGGTVYDVSSSAMFASTYSQWAGKDATVALAKMSLDRKDINRTDIWKNLSGRDQESLQSWMDYFDEKYYIKGQLQEYYNMENDTGGPNNSTSGAAQQQ